jgi:hypothetical protein
MLGILSKMEGPWRKSLLIAGYFCRGYLLFGGYLMLSA